VFLRRLQVLLDAWPEILEVDQLVVARAPPRAQCLVVELGSEQLTEMGGRVERRADRPDLRRPLVERELVAVLRVDLLPAAAPGSFRVDEETVEVEEEAADTNGVSIESARQRLSLRLPHPRSEVVPGSARDDRRARWCGTPRPLIPLASRNPCRARIFD